MNEEEKEQLREYVTPRRETFDDPLIEEANNRCEVRNGSVGLAKCYGCGKEEEFTSNNAHISFEKFMDEHKKCNATLKLEKIK